MKLHRDLVEAQKLAFEPSGLLLQNITREAESQNYGAYEFEINNCLVKFRIAKITPTKRGQFVTLWKRKLNGPIMPFDMVDPVQFFIISVRNGIYFGQFIFPKFVLYEKGYISVTGKGGKRAMRVYPPWDIADNITARKTQQWQLRYFVAISPVFDGSEKMKELFNVKA